VIAVDSSVWISALRSKSSPEAPVLTSLLDADEVVLTYPVRVELLSGAAKRDRPVLKRALTALPVIFPSEDTWRIVDEWIAQAGDAGHRFGFGDLLVAALARESGALVWSLDADFGRMRRLNLIDLYEP
jgi:predicted nucleic acid-binding protein